MCKLNHLNDRLETATWGLGLILVGGLSLIPGDQTDLAMLGLGMLLLGLNLVRAIRQIPVSYFSLTLGVIFLLVWMWGLITPGLGLGIQLELFPLLLIIFGLYLLIPSPKRKKTAKPVA